ncbi:peptidase [Vallitalea longa]|uniref:Peptidase n=1 Tax=Vallitalea longa TaxID=2936439 RepID=A0A9W5Y7V4_9FIRM|nr:slipin family protein [Vallitalea longa]GKX28272.1 peptidase [Vallitalea longa]
MKYYIKKNERGLLFKNGDYVESIQPGEHSYSSFLKYEVIVLDINQPFACKDYSLDTFMDDKVLLEELDILDVKDNELAFHYIDGKFSDIYESGKFVFWNINKKNDFKIVDITKPEISQDIVNDIFNITNIFNSKLNDKYLEINVRSYEKALLFYNNNFQRILEPGKYFYWTKYIDITVKTVDMRQQQLDMIGQEIMTADKVNLRINFSCQYKIIDILKTTLEIKDYANQLYILVQLILREYIGGVKLDDLLISKQDIADYVLSKLKAKEDEMGIKFIFAGIKDVVLPGEIKRIFNTVLLAEKKAQANVITRREEIASTRSLLNTAKLMDENKTLYKLKELEHIEKICEKVGNISLDSGSNVLNNLGNLFRGI